MTVLISLIALIVIGLGFFYIHRNYRKNSKIQNLPMAHDHFSNITTVPNNLEQKSSVNPNYKKPSNTK